MDLTQSNQVSAGKGVKSYQQSGNKWG